MNFRFSNLIQTVLLLPPAAIAYTAGARLRKAYPDKTVLECAGCGFELEAFVEAGHATIAPQDDLGPAQVIATWRGASRDDQAPLAGSDEPGLVRRVASASMRIAWKGHSLEAVQLKWIDMMAPQTVCFLIADSQGLGEEFYAAVCEWSSVPHGELLVFDQGAWRKDRSLFQSIQNSTFESLVLAPGLKEAFRADVRQFFSRREVYSSLGVPWKRGLLLLGPPGNGKTHGVKALCREAGVPALYVRSVEPQGMFHGSEQASIATIFEMARKVAPCLLIMEDLDALLKPANRSFLLNELDGFASNTGVCVIATTNYPERLDASIMDRPSRFDRKYEFGLPELSERLEYLTLWNSAHAGKVRMTERGLKDLAEAASGFSFAYLKELCLAATMARMNSDDASTMDEIALKQAGSLQLQMKLCPDSEQPEPTPSRKERFRKFIEDGV